MVSLGFYDCSYNLLETLGMVLTDGYNFSTLLKLGAFAVSFGSLNASLWLFGEAYRGQPLKMGTSPTQVVGEWSFEYPSQVKLGKIRLRRGFQPYTQLFKLKFVLKCFCQCLGLNPQPPDKCKGEAKDCSLHRIMLPIWRALCCCKSPLSDHLTMSPEHLRPSE